MSATVIVANVLAIAGLTAGIIDGRSWRAWLIAIISLVAFYPLIELFWLEKVVPWKPLITTHLDALKQLDFQVLVPSLLVPYFAGRLISRITGGPASPKGI